MPNDLNKATSPFQQFLFHDGFGGSFSDGGWLSIMVSFPGIIHRWKRNLRVQKRVWSSGFRDPLSPLPDQSQKRRIHLGLLPADAAVFH
jgi:hypothetical protein